MQHIKRFAHKQSLSEEDRATRKKVLKTDTLALTPNEELAALKGRGRFRLEPLTERESRAKKKAQRAKGKGFTKPMMNKHERRRKA